MNPAKKTSAAPVVDVQQLVADNDLGGRSPGPKVGLFLLGVALIWSLFVASDAELAHIVELLAEAIAASIP